VQSYLRKTILRGHVHVLKGMAVRCSNSRQLLRLVVGVDERESYDIQNSAPELETL
jgi:hypothetical protein